jgi:hypothetical protein
MIRALLSLLNELLLAIDDLAAAILDDGWRADE